MTKCEGTTRKPYATARRALVKDERVMKLFCEYTLETRQRGKGVVLLDYNHAVDHVRHYPPTISARIKTRFGVSMQIYLSHLFKLLDCPRVSIFMSL